MDMHYRSDVAGLQTFIEEALGQHNAIVFLNHSVFRGYTVMSLGTIWPSSTCRQFALVS